MKIGTDASNAVSSPSHKKPQTIEELKQWYKDMNLPDEKTTRFFIGTNYKKPRAFGIYKEDDTGNFIVYKNKGNGVRAIRYEGSDEAHAVNELYLKLKDEIANQKARIKREEEYKKQYNSPEAKKARRKIYFKTTGIIALIIGAVIGINILLPNRGYYHYGSNYYYYQSGSWYLYDDYYGWDKVKAPEELRKNHNDYYDTSSYDYSAYDFDRFEDSGYYIEPSSSSDSDSSWSSSDSWDSGSSDWDSDW